MIACLKERNKNVKVVGQGYRKLIFILKVFFSSLLNNHFLDNSTYVINSINFSIGSVLPVEIIWNNSNTVQRLITSRSMKEATVNRLQCFWFVTKVRIWWEQFGGSGGVKHLSGVCTSENGRTGSQDRKCDQCGEGEKIPFPSGWIIISTGDRLKREN